MIEQFYMTYRRGTNSQNQNWPQNNDNEVGHHIPQSPRTEVSYSDAVKGHIQDTHQWGVLLVCWGAVNIIYSPT